MRKRNAATPETTMTQGFLSAGKQAEARAENGAVWPRHAHGDERDSVSGALPYAEEVRAWERAFFFQGYAQELESELKIKERLLSDLRVFMGGRLPTDEDLFRAELIDGGSFMSELNESLHAAGRDVHRRPGVEEKRVVTAKIELTPSENSAAVKLEYKVSHDTPASKGTGLAYLDKDGRMVPATTADQIMLPLDHKKAA